MIAVIADDLTGAAELAGIGIRYGLATVLVMDGATETEADLFIVCTNSRSMTKAGAQRITGDVLKKLISVKPDLIYKKIDSVLRGHILDELKIQMLVSGKKKALVVAANPSLGRTIVNGNYFIGEQPIGETGFADDPEFALEGSSILEMLKTKAGEVMIAKHGDELPQEGIVIGEAASEEDIKIWIDKVDADWLLAGAGDFFTALLDKNYTVYTQPEAVMEAPHLYVSGTAFDKRQAFIKEAEEKLNCVIYLQAGSSGDEPWVNRVNEVVKEQGRAIIAIDKDATAPGSVSALTIRNAMAIAVKTIIERAGIKEVFIEGGATAASVLNELNCKSLELINELQRGVVRMKAKDIYITVKPGSYELPEQIAKLYLLK